MSLKPGIYEEVISIALDRAIQSDSNIEPEIEKLEVGDCVDALSRYALDILEKGLNLIKENRSKGENEEKANEAKVRAQIEVCNEIIEIIAKRSNEDDFLSNKICESATRLLSIRIKETSINQKKAERPASLSISSLFAGNGYGPQMATELKKEIATADRIDMLVSFIKNSGLGVIMEYLKDFTNSDGKLRVITTTYMGATDPEAIRQLAGLRNTEIKISYDTSNTRLHAKAYIFYRDTGYDTAYVGSSNLSGAAINGGLEWNVKLTNVDMAHIMQSIRAEFESYWASNDFTLYSDSDADFERLERSILSEGKGKGKSKIEYFFDIEPFPHQKEILEELEAERKIHGRFRNLLVSATGTGKTVVSALDYRRFCEQNKGKRNRLLFIAHRDMILNQSRECFRGILKDQNFGDAFYGQNKPAKFDHLFMSIQMFSSQKFHLQTEADYYDFIIIDEVHHGAADSYQKLLSHYKPKILLGMTATPERMDGLDIKKYFDDAIASEIRLTEAINRKMLVPFQYFCVTDPVSAAGMRFENGKYVVEDLNEAYIGNKDRLTTILKAIRDYAPTIEKIKGIGFCASQEHAKYMADRFNEVGIASEAIISNSSLSSEERKIEIDRLEKGENKFIFSVDIFNEGVDIPSVNTVLFLRPTESLTVFIQQLGRGLRHSTGKEELVVLDFIGQANERYRFENKFAAIVDVAYMSVKSQIETGFVGLPIGCNITMERVAEQYILNNIKKAVLNRNVMLSMIKTYSREVMSEISFDGFLEYNQITPEDFYEKSGKNSNNRKNTFYELCSEAGVIDSYECKMYDGNALNRISNIDSLRWMSTLKTVLIEDVTITKDMERAILMILYSFQTKGCARESFLSIEIFLSALKTDKYLTKEIIEIIKYKSDNIKFISTPLMLEFDNSLEVHCSYSVRQVMSALGDFTMDRQHPMLEGVFHLKNTKAHILFVTKEKDEKHFSPLTMYSDYAITDKLLHWQSQYRTSRDSDTGKQYVDHFSLGYTILIFLRAKKGDSYTCLGKARHVSHEGSRPMSIVWELEDPMSPWLFEKTRAVK